MRFVLLGSIFVVSLWTENTNACPTGEYEVCALVCFCVPNSGTVIDNVPGAPQAGAEVAGRALAEWIGQTRNNSISSAAPIPWQVRGALTGFIDEATLNRARYKVGDTGVLSLAGLTMQYGDPAAIVVDDLIVFRDGSNLNNRIGLWAHELTHVHQYAKWGVHSFAVQYVRNSAAVEAEATEAQNRYPAWLAARRVERGHGVSRLGGGSNPGSAIGTSGGNQRPPIGLQRGTIMQQCGCYGSPVAIEAAEPRCQSGAVVVSQCPGWCQYQNGAVGAAYGWLCR